MDHGSMAGMNGTTCQTSMLWNWYTIDACFLSSSWQIKNQAMFAASCIGVVLLAMLLEFLRRIGKEYDALILRQFKRHADAQQAAASAKTSNEAVNCCDPVPKPQVRVLTFRASPLQQLTRSVIHAITFGVAYIIMLLAMYYNGYLIICIVLGTGVGKFICDWMVHKVVVGGTDVGAPPPTGIDEPTVCCA